MGVSGNALYDLRCNHFAGSAPGCEAVENEEGIFVFERGVEILLPVMQNFR